MSGLSARERSPFGRFQLRPSHLVTGPSPDPPSRVTDGGFRPEVFAGDKGLDPQVVHRARLQVCGHATDAAEARMIMEMLGI